MNKAYAATLIDPETSELFRQALEVSGKSQKEIDALFLQALTLGAEALRQLDRMEDDLK